MQDNELIMNAEDIQDSQEIDLFQSKIKFSSNVFPKSHFQSSNAKMTEEVIYMLCMYVLTQILYKGYQ